jgi:choice-of-anchor A domain-containing protein
MIKFRLSPILLILLLVVPCGIAIAGPLGVAGDHNVFMFGDIVQWGTDVEGRVAAGGDVIYGRNGEGSGFSIASKVKEPKGLPDLVVGGSVTLTNGSVGYFGKENSGGPQYQKGTINYGNQATISETVGYGSKVVSSPIDFKSEQSYLQELSDYWGRLTPTGKVEKPDNHRVFFTGSDPNLNIFHWDTSTLATKAWGSKPDPDEEGFGFFFNVPFGSTVLVNIVDKDKDVNLTNAGFYIAEKFSDDPSFYIPQNDPETLTKYFKGDSDVFPNSKILFNFPYLADLFINFIEINGSILAPWADVFFGEESHIDGHLIATNLFGQGEAHNIIFDGKLPIQPVPEPATIMLLAGGLLGMAAWRRRS